MVVDTKQYTKSLLQRENSFKRPKSRQLLGRRPSLT